MSPRVWTAIACLVVGVPVAAWGLANGFLLIGLAGLALVLVFIFLVVEAMSRAARPRYPIVKSDNPAWAMKEQPVAADRDSGSGGSP